MRTNKKNIPIKKREKGTQSLNILLTPVNKGMHTKNHLFVYLFIYL